MYRAVFSRNAPVPAAHLSFRRNDSTFARSSSPARLHGLPADVENRSCGGEQEAGPARRCGQVRDCARRRTVPESGR